MSEPTGTSKPTISYLKPALNKKLKLNRTLSTNPSSHVRGGRSLLKEHIKQETRQRLKTMPREHAKRGLRHTARAVDHFDQEESHESIQSLELAREGTKKARNTFVTAKKASNRIKETGRSIRTRKEPRSFSARKSSSTKTQNTAVPTSSKIKMLTHRSSPKNKYSAALKGKAAVKKSMQLPAVQQAMKQLMKRLMASIASNPKVWIIGAAVGAVLFLLLMVTNNIGGASTSAAGSFFMTDEDNAKSYKNEIQQLNTDFQNKIVQLKNSGGYDDVRVEYMNEDGVAQANWVEVFAVLTVHFEQDLDFTDKQSVYLKELYKEFNEIKTSKQTYYEKKCRHKNGKKVCKNERKKRLIIKVYSYDMEDVFTKIGFNEEQEDWARRLVTSGGIQEQFPDLVQEIGGGTTGPAPIPINPGDYPDIENVGAARQQLIQTALTLVGKVSYFWGGKSAPGWNSEWGKPKLITAPGSEKSGTVRPYGLDCSGFIDWAFKTGGLGNTMSGGGTSYQWGRTTSISMSELQPGDLVFKNIPGNGGINHIGIYIGRNSNNNPLYVHCSSSHGVVVNSYKGFKYPRRPIAFQ
ncbi:C40 family peptidase [Paenibacillus shenyangensis]|uniref:C40 family peptidase n=1 Tax=Paenibacillus sp. A9 TaxID=1284352 RepID=UPI00036B4FA0|nr:NlpC/P60 family protein [Paenibacillus sp. A9]